MQANQQNTNQGSQKPNQQQITIQTKDKVDSVKSYIERKYEKLKIDESEKRENWQKLENKMITMDINPQEQDEIKKEIQRKEAELLRIKRQKITAADFEPIAIIGRGAFGEVRLCRWKTTQKLVAIKKMIKSEMIQKNQVNHIRAERDILANSEFPWIVELECSFQDEKYLYLVMEYLGGGDLMTLLMKKDILSEEESKFYIAEMILAVNTVHQLNYIHRDLKPDNILIATDGHIKLSDFGLCKHTEIKNNKQIKDSQDQANNKPGLQLSIGKKSGYKRNRQMAFSTVGTPDYIAPEVFAQNGYTEVVDWWSLGVILYEMLVGYPPFFSEDPKITCQKILNWRKSFVIPADANLSPAATDLIKRLVTDANERLGVNGYEEIKVHPFFVGVDWKNIRNKKPPYIPDLQSETDTQYFDKFEEEEPWEYDQGSSKKVRNDNNFVGYTYNRTAENQRSYLVTALEELENTRSSITRLDIPKNEQQNQQIQKQIDQKSNNQQEQNKQIQQQQKQNQQQLYKDNMNYQQTEKKLNEYDNISKQQQLIDNYNKQQQQINENQKLFLQHQQNEKKFQLQQQLTKESYQKITSKVPTNHYFNQNENFEKDNNQLSSTAQSFNFTKDSVRSPTGQFTNSGQNYFQAPQKGFDQTNFLQNSRSEQNTSSRNEQSAYESSSRIAYDISQQQYIQAQQQKIETLQKSLSNQQLKSQVLIYLQCNFQQMKFLQYFRVKYLKIFIKLILMLQLYS